MGRTGGHHAHDVVDVELVEHVEHVPGVRAAEHPDGVAPSAAPGAPVPARRRRAWAVVVVGLLLVVGTNVVQARQEAARRAALADLPGILSPLPRAPVELWSRAGWSSGSSQGVLLVTSPGGSVHGVDPASGTDRWSRVAPARGSTQWCTDLVHHLRRSTGATGSPPADGPVLCERVDWPADAPAPTTPHRTVLTALDPVTGDELGTVSLPGGLVVSTGVDADLVHAAVDAEGRLHAVRWDPRTGARAWEHRSPVPVLPHAGALQSASTADTITVMGGGGSVTLSVATGQEVPGGDPAAAGTQEVHLPDGVRVRTTYLPDRLSTRTEALEPDGSVRWALPGAVTAAQVLEPAAADVVLVTGPDWSRLRAVDVRSGDTMWTVDVEEPSTPLVQLDGVLVLGDHDGATALDLRTGTLLWTADVARSIGPAALTDGDVVVLPVPSAAGTVAAGLDLHEGTELWRAPLPAATRQVRADAGVLVAVTDRRLHALG